MRLSLSLTVARSQRTLGLRSFVQKSIDADEDDEYYDKDYYSEDDDEDDDEDDNEDDNEDDDDDESLTGHSKHKKLMVFRDLCTVCIIAKYQLNFNRDCDDNDGDDDHTTV